MIFIITGPSGVGKNTIINELSNHIDFHFSTSFSSLGIPGKIHSHATTTPEL